MHPIRTRAFGNESFFAGQDVELRMAKSRSAGRHRQRSAVFFVNHMKGDWGDDFARREDRKYKFDM